MQVIFIHHSCFLVETEGFYYLFPDGKIKKWTSVDGITAYYEVRDAEKITVTTTDGNYTATIFEAGGY